VYDNGDWPKPVGQKQPNGFELYDMLGNVWQRTADWSGVEYYPVSEKQDPSGPTGGPNVTMRTLRGGSWLVPARVVRVSSRFDREPVVRINSVGLSSAGE
jgi:formylglycine-generating enzyme